MRDCELGGHVHSFTPNINKNQVQGMLLSTILNFQVPILYTNNEKETAELLILLAKKQEKQKQQISLRPTKTLQSIEEQKQFILEGFPSIGPTIAKRLLEKFKTIKKIINASYEELQEVLGKNCEKFKQIIET